MDAELRDCQPNRREDGELDVCSVLILVRAERETKQPHYTET